MTARWLRGVLPETCVDYCAARVLKRAIEFVVARAAPIRLTVLDVQRRVTARLVDGTMCPARQLPCGVEPRPVPVSAQRSSRKEAAMNLDWSAALVIVGAHRRD